MSKPPKANSLILQADPRKLYILEADIHRYPRPLTTVELRQQLFFMLLFWDSIVISDSTFNNNRNLRPLLAPNIEKPARNIRVLADFEHLLKKGYLRPAMRNDLKGFIQLRDEHSSPKPVTDLPSFEYSYILDQWSPKKFRERWEREDVEACFKANLIKIFSVKNPWRDHRIPKAASQAILSFILSKGDDPIYYRELRHLMNNPGRYKALKSITGYDTAISKYYKRIDKLISEAYRYNVPTVLAIESEATQRTLPWWVSLGRQPESSASKRLETLKDKPLRPTWIFDREVIGEIPSQALDDVRTWSSFKEFMSLLKTADNLNFSIQMSQELSDIWEAYTAQLEKHLRGELRLSVQQEAQHRIKKTGGSFVTNNIVLPGIVTAICFFLHPLFGITSFALGVVTGWKGYRDYKSDMARMSSLSRLMGVPVIEKDLIAKGYFERGEKN
ncbi:MAG: hypothetical protein L0229_05640 [Blastocatellia bacterium]|nr:hypothetical protein [Blastocatellia bacterium]